DAPQLPHAVFKDDLIVIHAAAEAAGAGAARARLEEARPDGCGASIVGDENHRLSPPVERYRRPRARSGRRRRRVARGDALAPYVEAAERNLLAAVPCE